MDKRVKEMVDKCIACQSAGNSNNPEPMQITPTKHKPWTSVAIDFYGPIPRTGQYLLVVIDTYSKFPEVEIVNSTEAKTCIPKLDTIFANYGIPSKIKTDNGPPFNGKEFETYTRSLGIEWKCCHRKIYETNWKTIENNRNRRKELEARVTKVSTPIPLNSSRNYESRSL